LQAALLAGGFLPLRYHNPTDLHEMYASPIWDETISGEPSAITDVRESCHGEQSSLMRAPQLVKSVLALEGLNVLSLPCRKMLALFMYETSFTNNDGKMDISRLEMNAPLLGLVTDVDDKSAKWVRVELLRARYETHEHLALCNTENDGDQQIQPLCAPFGAGAESSAFETK
jgi:hypothetical protein